MSGGAIIMAEAGKAADYVFILDGTTSASADDLIYIAKNSVSQLISDTDLGNYYTYNAVVDGKIVEIMVDETAGNNLNGLFASYAMDDDGIYSDLTPAQAEGKDYLATTGDFKKASNEVITVGNAGTLAYTDDVVVYVIDADGDINTGSINRNYTGYSNIYYTVNSDGEVTSLYIVK